MPRRNWVVMAIIAEKPMLPRPKLVMALASSRKSRTERSPRRSCSRIKAIAE
jgi:hypothetical protein